MEVTFQVSLYPIAKEDFKTPINRFILELKKGRLDVDVHETSTIGNGEIENVFDTLKKAYMSAAKNGDAVMILTVVNGAPTKEELTELNR
ncbi:MAG TPA: YkoF family thiamine/hydroxymethylpyrimidine-binding protein [Candidatus Acidoferrales bacterium]|nr:YkoF family thiamine/hydroxymethylpyrimidine-binding protein [Candidatus Acidoferrales bacterium]